MGIGPSKGALGGGGTANEQLPNRSRAITGGVQRKQALPKLPPGAVKTSPEERL